MCGQQNRRSRQILHAVDSPLMSTPRNVGPSSPEFREELDAPPIPNVSAFLPYLRRSSSFTCRTTPEHVDSITNANATTTTMTFQQQPPPPQQERQWEHEILPILPPARLLLEQTDSILENMKVGLVTTDGNSHFPQPPNTNSNTATTTTAASGVPHVVDYCPDVATDFTAAASLTLAQHRAGASGWPILPQSLARDESELASSWPPRHSSTFPPNIFSNSAGPCSPHHVFSAAFVPLRQPLLNDFVAIRQPQQRATLSPNSLRKGTSSPRASKITWEETVCWSGRSPKKRPVHGTSSVANASSRTRAYVCSNTSCATTSSPLWRKGWTNKDGTVSMLCNACGLHYKKGHFCCKCNQIFKESEMSDFLNPFICCAICKRYVHLLCARVRNPDDNPEDQLSIAPPLLCPDCLENLRNPNSEMPSSFPSGGTSKTPGRGEDTAT